MLNNIDGNSDSKANEEQGIFSEEDLNNNFILDSGYPIDIFSNPQLVIDLKRSNQVIRLSTNAGPKINKMQEMVVYYGKLWYYDKAIANIFSLTKLYNKYRVTYDSHQDYDLLFAPIEVLSSSGEINK